MALQLKLDPTQLEAGAQRAENALTGVKGAAVQAESAIDRVGKTAPAALAPLTAEAGRVGQAASGMGFKIQNAAFQVGDFAVQVASGTSATRALAQQLPQLLGGFGVAGAVIGGLVAVGAAVAPMFIDMGQSASEAEGRIDDLSSTLGDYIDYTRTALTATGDLQTKFGVFADQIRQHAQFMANVSVSNAVRQLSDENTVFSQSLNDVALAQRRAADAATFYAKTQAQEAAGFATADAVLAAKDAFSVYAIEADNAATALGLTGIQAAKLNDALQRLATDSGGGMGEIHADAAAVNALLVEMTNNGENITPAIAELAARMFDVEQTSSQALGLQQEFTPALNSASGAANGLANAMGGVASAAWNALVSFNAMANARVRASLPSLGAGPAGMGSAPPEGGAVGTSPRPGRRGVDSVTFGGGTGGGGGGGGSAVDHTREAYDRLMASLDPVVAKTQDMAKATATADAALAAHDITAAEHAHAMDLIRDKYTQTADAMKDLQEVGGNAIDGLIGGTKNLSQALKDMAKDLVLATIKAQLLKSVTGSTSSMSLGTIIMGGLTGGFHDAGGRIPMGTTGMVGERGPELVTAGPNGAMVTSRVETARAMQSQSIHVSISVDDEGKIKALVQQSGKAAMQGAVSVVRRNLANWNNDLQRDGALA